MTGSEFRCRENVEIEPATAMTGYGKSAQSNASPPTSGYRCRPASDFPATNVGDVDLSRQIEGLLYGTPWLIRSASCGGFSDRYKYGVFGKSPIRQTQVRSRQALTQASVGLDNILNCRVFKINQLHCT